MRPERQVAPVRNQQIITHVKTYWHLSICSLCTKYCIRKNTNL